jgi:hypothetical protein
MRSEDVAFSRLAAIGPSPAEKARLAEINKGIDFTMAQVIRDSHYDPRHALDKPEKVTPVGAVPAREPGVPQASEPWRPMHPSHDWLRLGSTVAQARARRPRWQSWRRRRKEKAENTERARAVNGSGKGESND